MSVAYGLYNRKNKTWLYLGKRRGWTDDGSARFDVSPEKIVEFLSRDLEGEGCTFELLPDTINLPDEVEDGWTELWADEID